jgi:LCCL domain
MIIKTIGKNRGNIFIWLALFIFSLIMPCAVQATTLLKVEVQPQTAVPWRTLAGPIIAVVTGTTSGKVYGGGGGAGPGNTSLSDVYTDDSSISTAAVHAGILADGKTGLVAIYPQSSGLIANGTPKNAVTPVVWAGTFTGCKLQKYTYLDTTTLADPGSFAGWGYFDNWVDTTSFKVSLTGLSSGSIWGTNTYTSDSSIALAAVHAGKLNVGVSEEVLVTLSKGLKSYEGSTRYGVTSNSFGAYDTSFNFGGTCDATIDKSLLLFIPSCTYDVPFFDRISLWLKLDYVFSATPDLQRFKLVDFGINDSATSCTTDKAVLTTTTSGSAISIKIKLTDVKLPNKTSEDFTLTSVPTISQDNILYFSFQPD